ncbi:hypothetical protein [Solirhodobacter olei]|uniref:hypothetical protein n=1 Tax=Solirhodobacter olei TaxID=2493082 RepID=UPI000FDB8F61|nr:hypothetical protein [Solirhodobacter olei]
MTKAVKNITHMGPPIALPPRAPSVSDHPASSGGIGSATDQADFLAWARAKHIGVTLVSADGQTLGTVEDVRLAEAGLLHLAIRPHPGLGLRPAQVWLKLRPAGRPGRTIEIALTAAQFSSTAAPRLEA